MKTRQGWGFKIDYDKAIAEDEAEIARLTDPTLVALCQSLTEDEIANYMKGHRLSVIDLFFNETLREARRAIVGLTSAQAAQVVLCYQDGSAYYGDAYDKLAAAFDSAVKFQAGAFYREGAALSEKLFAYQITPEQKRVEFLKKAKASLTRHRRNKAKYGS